MPRRAGFGNGVSTCHRERPQWAKKAKHRSCLAPTRSRPAGGGVGLVDGVRAEVGQFDCFDVSPDQHATPQRLALPRPPRLHHPPMRPLVLQPHLPPTQPTRTTPPLLQHQKVLGPPLGRSPPRRSGRSYRGRAGSTFPGRSTVSVPQRLRRCPGWPGGSRRLDHTHRSLDADPPHPMPLQQCHQPAESGLGVGQLTRSQHPTVGSITATARLSLCVSMPANTVSTCSLRLDSSAAGGRAQASAGNVVSTPLLSVTCPGTIRREATTQKSLSRNWAAPRRVAVCRKC